MRIAVTYDNTNGEVFQHFGKTEFFKIYETENDKVLSAEVLSAGGVGHEALAGVLARGGVDVVICGGLGAGMQAALADAGIRVVSGAAGDADRAVEAFLGGTMESQGVNCEHHSCHGTEDEAVSGRETADGTDSAEESSEDAGCCGGDCGSGCGGGDCESGCGGGCGGCGGQELKVILEGKNAGKKVKTHYRGTFNDGTQFDSSYDRGEPLEFICGAGMMIPGFDKAVVNMEVGEETDIHLSPEEAYGMPDPKNVFTFPIADLEGSDQLQIGQKVYLTSGNGRPFPVVVTAKDEKNITLDANHEMAGKELNFHIELISAE